MLAVTTNPDFMSMPNWFLSLINRLVPGNFTRQRRSSSHPERASFKRQVICQAIYRICNRLIMSERRNYAHESQPRLPEEAQIRVPVVENIASGLSKANPYLFAKPSVANPSTEEQLWRMEQVLLKLCQLH